MSEPHNRRADLGVRLAGAYFVPMSITRAVMLAGLACPLFGGVLLGQRATSVVTPISARTALKIVAHDETGEAVAAAILGQGNGTRNDFAERIGSG